MVGPNPKMLSDSLSIEAHFAASEPRCGVPMNISPAVCSKIPE